MSGPVVETGHKYVPKILATTEGAAATGGGATTDFGKYISVTYDAVDAKTFESEFPSLIHP